jgi:hypothetical protein
MTNERQPPNNTGKKSLTYPVMKAKCATCPFRTDERGRHVCPDVTNRVMQRIVSEASQICHHPQLLGKQETHLCRGARDFQLDIFHRLGVIDAPTDAAWQRRLDENASATTPTKSPA